MGRAHERRSERCGHTFASHGRRRFHPRLPRGLGRRDRARLRAVDDFRAARDVHLRRASLGLGRGLGTLAESEAILLRRGRDATQSTWQRALQAKTAAVRRLELELERRDLRIRALEVDRATREEGDAFASGEDDASRLATEADASRALALRPASAVIDDMRRDMEDREYRLTALTEAIHRSSERSVENEVAVSAARDELVARAERYRASETRLARQLEASRAVEENLREEIREGERAFGLLQSQFAAVVARARESRARVAAGSASRLASRTETSKTTERRLDEASREMRTVTDASRALELLREACDGIAAKRAMETKGRPRSSPASGDDNAYRDDAENGDGRARGDGRSGGGGGGTRGAHARARRNARAVGDGDGEPSSRGRSPSTSERGSRRRRSSLRARDPKDARKDARIRGGTVDARPRERTDDTHAKMVERRFGGVLGRGCGGKGGRRDGEGCSARGGSGVSGDAAAFRRASRGAGVEGGDVRGEMPRGERRVERRAGRVRERLGPNGTRE